MRVIEPALPPGLFRRARAAVKRLGTSRLQKSYWTTFWLPRSAKAAHPIEEAVVALARFAAPARASGMEWWIGRSYTSAVPIGFHFDQDVKARTGLRHPLVSTVFFFNRVKGGQLAVTDQVPGPGGGPRPAEARRLETAAPAPNRYAIFRGDRFHGVLDERGRTPGRPRPGPRGVLRVTLVVNYWDHRPTGVPRWSETRIYRALAP